MKRPTRDPRPMWAAIRRWLRPPRRLRFSRSGWAFVLLSLVVGTAAIPTGNNLLFLLLGAMLGFITVSGWLSEQVIRALDVRRRVPRGVTAAESAHMTYEIGNRKQRIPSFALEVGEMGYAERAFVPDVQPGKSAYGRAEMRWPRRGVYPLVGVTVATSFPFGLFRKERDLELPGEVLVWPRHDLPVREPRPAGNRARLGGAAHSGGAGARGEFRNLREYRPGDDPRDVHWRSTARAGIPVVREYERDQGQAFWLALDLRAPAGDAAEAAAATAASLAAQAVRRGQPFGLATPDARLDPADGPAQLERALDILARAQFRPDAPPPRPPVPPGECVLVTCGAPGGAWADVYRAAG